MAKEISAPLLRAERLLDLVPYLHAHQGISVSDLAKKFNVTHQQIMADLSTLWMCGLPGYTPLELMELDFESGYVTIRNATTLSKPRLVNFDEGLALLLGLDLVTNSLPDDRQDLIKASEELSARIAQKVGMKSIPEALPKSSPEFTQHIDAALKTRGGLRISYHSLYTDTVTDRDVSPNRMYERDTNLYLRAYCFEAKAFREFRVDRIIALRPIKIEPVPQTLVPENSPLEYSLRVIRGSRDVAERFEVDEITPPADLNLSSYSQQWVERSVLASGESVVLTSPESIRVQIASKAQLILDRYRGN